MSPVIRVLYAEDNAQDADLTRAHFSEHAPDILLEVAETGRDCLTRLNGGAHDVLLLDHYLPDMDGLDVLRALARCRVAVPVVLVTSAGDEEMVVKALRAGATDYVPKQGSYLETLPDLLRAVIVDYRSRQARGLLDTSPRRILYVEHQEMDIELTLRHFAENVPGMEFDVVRSFPEARELLHRASGHDAVLLDLRMPGQSGLDFVHECRSRAIPMPPFIVITGRGDEAAAIASMRLGAADYITKREGYLDELPHALERAIARDRIDRLNAKLQAELAERKRVEAEFLQAQRMAAIGRLAGGVAHDFNNVLSVILAYTDSAMAQLREGDPIREDLLEVRRAGERAVAVTRQLLAFSRKQILQPVPLNLNEVVTRLEKMLRPMVGEDVEFVQVLAPELGVTRADLGQMEQVIMNLVVNARDAMPTGGRLTIETANVAGDGEFAARCAAVEQGTYVQLSVTDTGCGMDAQTKASLFEPFFTTKGPGKGTGLGLSTVYGIIKQSGGNIYVQSEPNRGSTFRVLLPRDPSPTPAVFNAPPPATRASGTEAILVVEDEEPLRRSFRRTLEAAGYTVLTAAVGHEALEVSARHSGEIHLLFTDVVMPGMSGRVLAQELAKTRPRVKVLFTSGYTDDSIVRYGVLDAVTPFIAKPFAGADLIRKIREVLDDAGPGAS